MDYRIEQLRYQLREDPSSRVFYSLAEALRRQGGAEEAVAVLRRGLEIHPRYAAAWVALGRAQRDLDDSDSAGKAFGRALELDRTNVVAARAVGELASEKGDWEAAVAAFSVVGEALPEDSDIQARISEAQSRIAEEAAEREASAAPPPPAEVVRLSDGDPFSDDAVDEDQFGPSDDVFVDSAPAAEVVEASFSEETVADAAADSRSVAEGTDDPEVTQDRGEQSVEIHLPEDDEDQPAFESWADVTDEDHARSFGEAQVAPPLDSETVDPEPEAAGAGEPPEPRPEPEIPEFEEPIIEESPEPPVEPEPESWDDLDNEDLSGVVQEFETPAEVEPIIPETLAAFDRPTDDLEEEESERATVQPEDVPLPTLTLARLALQQGDNALAEATLASLIERDPSNAEAVELLDGLRSAPPEQGRGTTSAKVAALRGWLDTIRLASERQ